jgi:hypothetical protein
MICLLIHQSSLKCEKATCIIPLNIVEMKKKLLMLFMSLMIGISCATQQEPVQSDDKGGRCVKGNCKYGVGTYLFPNGNRYEGEFRSNVPFGYGTMYYKNGKSIKGKWKWGRPDLR